MGALEEVTALHALALALAKELEPQEVERLGLLLIQLGTTLTTISGVQGLDSEVAAESLQQ